MMTNIMLMALIINWSGNYSNTGYLRKNFFLYMNTGKISF